MTQTAWTGTPVRPHPDAADNGAERLPWGRRRDRLPLRWPFGQAVDGFRRKALGNAEYDPAATFVWGQMMAVGLIEMLKGVEEAFGGEGHDAAREALRRVGEKIAREMLADVEIPPDMAPEEVASLFASWVNEVCYASIEDPRAGDGRAEFDIHYCPHEDVYGAFDCRVQRYLVQGMIDGAHAIFGDRGLDVRFTSTIPAGSRTCHFDIYPGDGDRSDWSAYSDRLRDRALLQIREKPRP